MMFFCFSHVAVLAVGYQYFENTLMEQLYAALQWLPVDAMRALEYVLCFFSFISIQWRAQASAVRGLRS